MPTLLMGRELKGKLFLHLKENGDKFRLIIEKLRLDIKMCMLCVESLEK